MSLAASQNSIPTTMTPRTGNTTPTLPTTRPERTIDSNASNPTEINPANNNGQINSSNSNSNGGRQTTNDPPPNNQNSSLPEEPGNPPSSNPDNISFQINTNQALEQNISQIRIIDLTEIILQSTQTNTENIINFTKNKNKAFGLSITPIYGSITKKNNFSYNANYKGINVIGNYIINSSNSLLINSNIKQFNLSPNSKSIANNLSIKNITNQIFTKCNLDSLNSNLLFGIGFNKFIYHLI